MRFHLGAIPLSPDFSPDATWTPLREPTAWMVQVFAFPIGVATAGTLAALWFYITPLGSAPATLAGSTVLLLLAGVVVVHELIHAAMHPRMGRSPHSILGAWPSRGVFYAHYDGEMSRNRLVAILLAPLLVISFLPLAVVAIIQSAPAWLAFCSCVNALLACVDILGAGMLLAQVPATATVRNQGWYTYWREPAVVAQ